MKTWISKWLIFVSTGHTVVGFLLFGDIYMQMVLDGLFKTVDSQNTAAATWYLLFGFLLFIVSFLILTIEKNDALEVPTSIGIALFMLTTLGVILMPASGFWLVYPAAIGIIFKNKKQRFQ
jgi:uncharacterized membrane protein